jgi:hypothetical protein
MGALARLRAVLFSNAEPPFYWQLWLTSVNLIGLFVVLGVVFDVRAILGPEGPRGIFQRALYPLFPAALTLGAALAERRPRRILLSGGALVGYVAVLGFVGVVDGLVTTGRAFLLAGTVGCLVFLGLGVLLALRAERPVG